MRAVLVILSGIGLANLAGATAVAAVTSSQMTPETLASLYQDVLKNPADVKANMRYARMAEVEGKLRLALATYERVLVNNPSNREAQAGYLRIRRMLQPPSTKITVNFGAGIESNPRNLPDGSRDEGVFVADLSMRDERTLNGWRWRTDASLDGEYTTNIQQLTYGYGGLAAGPLFDVATWLTLQPALGGGAATLDRAFYYAEGYGALTLEGRFGGAFQRLRFRGGYRSYGETMTAEQGEYADVSGRFSFPKPWGSDGVVVVAPWTRWSGIDGTVRNDVNEDVSPAKYVEWGAELGYYFRPLENLTLGPRVLGRERLFQETFVSGEKRNDIYLSPGVNATIAKILPCDCDVLVDYDYRFNLSNEATARYQGQRVTLSVATQF